MDNINKTLISKEIVKFEHPPTYDELKNKEHDELLSHLVNIGVPLAQLEAISDKDKRRTYMIQETLRLEKPFPKSCQPVLINTECDMNNNNKILTYKYVKHLYEGEKESRSYKHSEVTIEKYTLPLQDKDIKNYEKNQLLNDINNEVQSLNLEEWKRREEVLSFACDNGKSNTERKRRLVALSRALVDNGYKRHRFTTQDISMYNL